MNGGTELRRALGARQMAMIAIGGAIGTGLFLGSGFAIALAGPSVLLSYAVGGLIALLLMRALSEMVARHPRDGGFGALAERYLGAAPGFLLRWAYWSANVLAIGTEVTAVAVYMRLWFPAVPGLWWIGGFSALLVGVNLLSVRVYGAVEYGFSAVKVAAIAVFLLLGAVLLLHPPAGASYGFPVGELFPHGVGGTWVAVVVAIFSFMSIEAIAVAAGEAADPARAVRRAFRMTLGRLLFFYLGTLFVTLSIVPWRSVGGDTSPFTLVMRLSGVPGAAAAVNAVLLVAALSSMNEQLYTAGRMLHGLAGAGLAPRGLARVSRQLVPVRALLASSAGVAVAAGCYAWNPDGAFPAMIALSMFGALFTWGTIFLTHRRFRIAAGGRGSLGSTLGFGLVAAILLTTPFTAAFRATLLWGVPFSILLLAAFPFARAARRREVAAPG
ncbi:MAG: amino acid permease [Gluconacetobacter diazotrophicus]|nr:amino acid permease [Gluconacetobacter diazotrophicus]